MLTKNQILIGDIRKLRKGSGVALENIKKVCSPLIFAPTGYQGLSDEFLDQLKDVSESCLCSIKKLEDEFTYFDLLVDRVNHYEEDEDQRLNIQSDIISEQLELVKENTKSLADLTKNSFITVQLQLLT